MVTYKYIQLKQLQKNGNMKRKKIEKCCQLSFLGIRMMNIYIDSSSMETFSDDGQTFHNIGVDQNCSGGILQTLENILFFSKNRFV